MSTKKKPSYKEASEELEAIVAEMDSGTIDIDLLADKVKRATYLIKYCREKLRATGEEVKEALEGAGDATLFGE